ncbi:MAG: LysR family transcriptional regulator, partial [Eubacterium callanderi]
ALVRGTNCFSIGPDLTNSDADRMHSNMSEVRAIRLLDNDQRLHAGYILRNEHSLSAIGEKYIKVLTEKIKAFEKWD